MDCGGDAPQTVAERATTAGTPKSANAEYSDWSEKNIIALIGSICSFDCFQ